MTSTMSSRADADGSAPDTTAATAASPPASTAPPATTASPVSTRLVSAPTALPAAASSTAQPAPTLEVWAEVLQEAGARLGTAVQSDTGAGLDATLLTPEHLALPTVVAAVRDYLAVRAQCHAQLRAHLSSASTVLRRSGAGYASTEQEISDLMRSVAQRSSPASGGRNDD